MLIAAAADWGRGANYNQQIVAKMMGKLGQCYRPEFVISTGDNFVSAEHTHWVDTHRHTQ